MHGSRVELVFRVKGKLLATDLPPEFLGTRNQWQPIQVRNLDVCIDGSVKWQGLTCLWLSFRRQSATSCRDALR